ncbi:MAG: beta-galactosidase trimerization domain-containing protein [Lentisphaeria bacterium]|nr:beta-galactosidase trimerization domain-containing protein [Lentisphaeria bacterium]
MNKQNWQKKCYARMLVDNHITDCKKSYMSKFSPDEYVRMMKLAGTESSMVYACDHNGNCYYPTRNGHQHEGLNGRDIFGETVKLLKKENITPIAYYTATYHNDCAKKFPHAVTVNPLGKTHNGRYHYTCPNQIDAENFYKEQIAEILSYDVDGLFIDMSFWPFICCCEACKKKFGKKIPQTIDWSNPNWIEFQRFREKSMADFAQRLTDFAKSIKDISVVHQFSPVLHGWYLGQSSGIALASDYASGDFYGNILQQRFAVKAFEAFTQNGPFEFMTSRCVNLSDHTSSKSKEELYLSGLTTLANGGAYFFIDAINPDGTLEEKFYTTLGEINAALSPFREAIKTNQAQLDAKVGIYFSIANCVDRNYDGMNMVDIASAQANNMSVRKNAVLDEVLGTAAILTKLHVPYQIITDYEQKYSKFETIILNRATYLRTDECEKLRKFVADGGKLIVSGDSSLFTPTGLSNGNFALSDVLGVEFTGKYSDSITYTGDEKILANGKVPLVKALPDAQVKAKLIFPDFPVDDAENYASIHSNPPGEASEFEGVVINNYGKGKTLYIAAPIFILQQYTQQEYGKKLLKEFLPEFIIEDENLAASAEITCLSTSDSKVKFLCIVNNQNDLPVIPLYELKLSIKLSEKVKEVIRVSDGEKLDFEYQNGVLTLKINKIIHGEFYKIQL